MNDLSLRDWRRITYTLYREERYPIETLLLYMIKANRFKRHRRSTTQQALQVAVATAMQLTDTNSRSEFLTAVNENLNLDLQLTPKESATNASHKPH